MITFPKDTPAFSWTRHIKNKMVFYHLSGAQILRIFRKPARREEGIATNTVAAMIPRSSNSSSSLRGRSNDRGNPSRTDPTQRLEANSYKLKAPSEEIWIMYKLNSLKANSSKLKASRITLISAWRYPGVTKPGERPQIPEDVAEMLEKGIY
jgi:hypothetical protein